MFLKTLLALVVSLPLWAADATLGLSSQRVNITGGDGLYQATVDSVGRMSVNANVTFPEAVYVTQDLVNGSSKAMNVNGTLATPILFSWQPGAGTGTWYIESLTITKADNAAFNLTGFGGLGALANGLLITFRSKGVVYTWDTLNTTLDVFNFFGDTLMTTYVTGLLSADASVTGTARVSQRIVLDPNFTDYIRIAVRDNLTGLTGLQVSVRAWKAN